MKRQFSLILSFLLTISFLALVTAPSHAVKTGSSCKKMNAKNWDKNTPVVCKRLKGKLVWTKFSESTSSDNSRNKPTVTPAPSPSPNTISIVIFRPGVYLLPEDDWAKDVCDAPSSTPFTPPRADINASTTIEIRDSQNSIVGMSILGTSTLIYPGTVIRGEGLANIRGICIFRTNIQVKDSDFYQIKVGNLGTFETYSKGLLQEKRWNLRMQLVGTSNWLPHEQTWLAVNSSKY